ncbi:MAG: hypothetical protein WAU69_03055 [Solirubrobacteraceae bacterium]
MLKRDRRRRERRERQEAEVEGVLLGPVRKEFWRLRDENGLPHHIAVLRLAKQHGIRAAALNFAIWQVDNKRLAREGFTATLWRPQMSDRSNLDN